MKTTITAAKTPGEGVSFTPAAAVKERVRDAFQSGAAMISNHRLSSFSLGAREGRPPDPRVPIGKTAHPDEGQAGRRLVRLPGQAPATGANRRMEAVTPADAGAGPASAPLARFPFTASPGNHTGLPDKLKVGIEALSGISLDEVRVHYNSPRPTQLSALAYTQGRDIHVAPGQEQHLPHEAWHVVQQAQGRVQPTLQMKRGVPVNDEKGLEDEADVMGAKAVAPAGKQGSYAGQAARHQNHETTQVKEYMGRGHQPQLEKRNGASSFAGEFHKPAILAGVRHQAGRVLQMKKCTFYANDDCTGSKFDAQSFHNITNSGSDPQSWNCGEGTTCNTPVPKKGHCNCGSGHESGKEAKPKPLTKTQKQKQKMGKTPVKL